MAWGPRRNEHNAGEGGGAVCPRANRVARTLKLGAQHNLAAGGGEGGGALLARAQVPLDPAEALPANKVGGLALAPEHEGDEGTALEGPGTGIRDRVPVDVILALLDVAAVGEPLVVGAHEPAVLLDAQGASDAPICVVII